MLGEQEVAKISKEKVLIAVNRMNICEKSIVLFKRRENDKSSSCIDNASKEVKKSLTGAELCHCRGGL